MGIQGRTVIAENIITGEVLEFQSQRHLSNYFMDIYDIEISTSNVSRLIEQKKPYRKTWRVYYKEDLSDEEIKAIARRATQINETPKWKKELVHKLVTMLAPYRTAK